MVVFEWYDRVNMYGMVAQIIALIRKISRRKYIDDIDVDVNCNGTILVWIKWLKYPPKLYYVSSIMNMKLNWS